MWPARRSQGDKNNAGNYSIDYYNIHVSLLYQLRTIIMVLQD
jgi:hypothetical protein